MSRGSYDATAVSRYYSPGPAVSDAARCSAVIPEERRRRGIVKVVIGVGILALVVIITFVVAPVYYQ